jgi:alpha-glucosidase
MFDDAFDGTSTHELDIDERGDLRLLDRHGQTVLAGIGAATLGLCGSAWLVQFNRDAEMRFYGQGEKVTGLEKSGRRTRFWNADVFADHAMSVIVDGQADPQYASIPYLLVHTGPAWIGLLVDHPGAVFMDTGSNWFFSAHDNLGAPASFWFGADQGVPAFYLIAGNDPASVTRRLQRLVGTTPLPPLWALGHHQCRWGYAGTRDLLALDEAFRSHEMPCDGLWLDIDYMDRYKVFSTNPLTFGDVRDDLRQLHERGRRIVPILDPGVKVEPGDALAQGGLDAGIYCLNPEGQPYVGFVWPGRTWFPDFSLPEGRAWWASQAQAFRELGFDGAWIDMNDPATGAAETDDMRFQRGAWPHWAYHNVYATGMAEATRAGFEAARPDERAFVLSRSASTGASRWTAVWTGDNWSNWHHLRNCIHGTLNLALSGLPFNGPDVPGFGGHADKDLAIAWYKVCFLFPFLRNHSGLHSARQEPWAFGTEALEIIRHYVRLRYKLLPYLYQLWVAQAGDGSAVLRPLLHDYANLPGQSLDRSTTSSWSARPSFRRPWSTRANSSARWCCRASNAGSTLVAGAFMPAGTPFMCAATRRPHRCTCSKAALCRCSRANAVINTATSPTSSCTWCWAAAAVTRPGCTTWPTTAPAMAGATVHAAASCCGRAASTTPCTCMSTPSPRAGNR